MALVTGEESYQLLEPFALKMAPSDELKRLFYYHGVIDRRVVNQMSTVLTAAVVIASGTNVGYTYSLKLSQTINRTFSFYKFIFYSESTVLHLSLIHI